MSLTAPVRPTRKLAAAWGVAILVLGASACGDGNDENASGGTYQSRGGARDQRGGPGGDGRMPGANGKVAALDGSTAQVRGVEGQVAVSWSASTTFTKEVGAALSDVKVGSCVLVAASGEPTASSEPATAVTATSVRITAKTNGSCATGMRGPGGQAGGAQLNGTPPSGAPGGGQRPQGRTFGGAVGEVAAVSATGFTVDSVLPGSDDKTPVTVSVAAATKYSRTVSGAAADVKVGVCVAANGTTDDTGAVTATTIAVTQPVDGQCGGLMRFGSGTDGPSGQES